MRAFFLGLALASSLAATAQTTVPAFTSTCREMGSGGPQQRFCETRDLRMSAPAGQALAIDGGTNGGITVRGWDGPDVRIRATVQAFGDTGAEAQARALAVVIEAAGTHLRATDMQNGSVSFEVFVPRRQALALRTHNGGISLAGLQGTIDFHAQNGGVSLAGLGGQVTGSTVNGELAIRLAGSQWQGQGLDVQATNGGISWRVPAGYSAQFFTSTANSGISTTLPVARKQYSNYQEVKASLGTGGQPVKAVTVNGGITIRQEG